MDYSFIDHVKVGGCASELPPYLLCDFYIVD